MNSFRVSAHCLSFEILPILSKFALLVSMVLLFAPLVRANTAFVRVNQLGYEAGTLSRAYECGVKYHASQAWRILRQLGWSCQRPVGRALERDEDKIRQWKQKRWPEIKKKPKTKGARSSSSTKAE